MQNSKLSEEMFDLMTQGYSEVMKLYNELASTGADGVLYCLYQKEDGVLGASELKNNMDLTSGRVSNILKQLGEKGYITRTISPDDRRTVFVSITEQGREHIRTVKDENLKVLGKKLSALEEKDAEEFVRCLTILCGKKDQSKESGVEKRDARISDSSEISKRLLSMKKEDYDELVRLLRILRMPEEM